MDRTLRNEAYRAASAALYLVCSRMQPPTTDRALQLSVHFVFFTCFFGVDYWR
jgi:hypothetical protein